MSAPLAMALGIVVIAWIGLALALALLLVAVMLFNRVIRPAREIRRYADDILEGGLGIARNVDGVDGLLRTRELVMAVPRLALAYLARLGAGHR